MARKYTVSDGKLVLVLQEAEEGGYIITASSNDTSEARVASCTIVVGDTMSGSMHERRSRDIEN